MRAERQSIANHRRARYLALFRRDLQTVLDESEEHFGIQAADRYANLIDQALTDILEDPLRPGTSTRSGLAKDARTYHLTFSRDRVIAQRVKTPRHFVLYRYTKNRVDFARLLHDSRDFLRHMPPNFRS